MKAEACFECEDQKVTLFYPHVEALVLGGIVPFGDLSAGGWYQRSCPYCVDEDPPSFNELFAVLISGGGLGNG